MSRKIHRTCTEAKPVNIVTILEKNKSFKGITGGETFGSKARAALKDTKAYNPDVDSYSGFGSAPSFDIGAGETIKSDPDAYSKILNPGTRQTSKKMQRYARRFYKNKGKIGKHRPEVNEETVAKYQRPKGAGKKAKIAQTKKPGPELSLLFYTSSSWGGIPQFGLAMNKTKLAFLTLMGRPLNG